MEQLSLEVRLADYALFDTFYEGPNAAPVHALREIARTATFAVVWLWGPADTGKTHLLQAFVNAFGRDYRSTYLPLGQRSGFTYAVLEGMGELDLVCVDDVDRVAGHKEWEHALFGLFESLRQSDGRLVLSAKRSPLHCAFGLPDLISRLASGTTFRLRPLSDEDKLKALQLRAEWRGLHLPDDTARYLIARVGRGCSQLFSLLDQLDSEALAAKRKLTVPFVKAILEK